MLILTQKKKEPPTNIELLLMIGMLEGKSNGVFNLLPNVKEFLKDGLLDGWWV